MMARSTPPAERARRAKSLEQLAARTLAAPAAVEPVLGPSSNDVQGVKHLLLWARQQQITLTRVQVGAVVLEVGTDLKLAGDLIPPRVDDAEGLIGQYGGHALRKVLEDAAGTPPLIEDDEDDVDEAPAPRRRGRRG